MRVAAPCRRLPGSRSAPRRSPSHPARDRWYGLPSIPRRISNPACIAPVSSCKSGPPRRAPEKGDHNILFRFRYMEVLYVIVEPAAADPHLVDAGLQAAGKGFDLIYKMTNDGSAFVRPFLSFNLKDAAGKVVREEKAHETTILLPGAKLAERIPLDGVPPGKYQLSVAVDFRDDKPIQSMVRTIDVAPEAPAVAAAAPAQPKQ